jgi:sensor histidine kinase YesM
MIIKKVFLKISYCFSELFRPLTENEKKFIEMNSSFWAEQKPKKVREKYVFVAMEQYPLILVGNAHISSLIAAAKKLKLLFLIPSSFERPMKKVLGSFPNSTFLYGNSWRYLMFHMLAYFQAAKVTQSFKTPDDVLAFKIDGIRIGDLIYDSYLACGYATMGKINASY